jgi:hypothetical protein
VIGSNQTVTVEARVCKHVQVAIRAANAWMYVCMLATRNERHEQNLEETL